MEQQQKPLTPQTPLNQTVPLLKKIPKIDFKNKSILIAIVVAIILLGLGTGWLASGRKQSFISQPGSGGSAKEAGLSDTSSFKDTAEGTLVEGGIGGEGTHHLERIGGPSQNVYLTSSAVDLQSFVGKKVKVWGQTLSGKKAGWLMDVGKIQVE